MTTTEPIRGRNAARVLMFASLVAIAFSSCRCAALPVAVPAVGGTALIGAVVPLALVPAVVPVAVAVEE